jgi:hypothetical protein
MQREIGHPGTNSSRECSLGSAGKLDCNEMGLGVEIIFSRLVDDADVPFSPRVLVWQALVDLSQFQVVTSPVANAQEKFPLASW